MNGFKGLTLEDFVSIAPMFFIFIGSLLPITFKIFRKNEEPQPIVAFSLAMIGVIAALASSIQLFSEVAAGRYAFSQALVIDGVAVFSIVIITIITACAALMAKEHKSTAGEHFSEFLFLLLNSALGMMVLVCANDLIVMFVGIEVMSLCLYLLIALSKEQVLSKEASFKYFLLGSFASAIFLYGVALTYGVSGTTYLNALAAASAELIANNKLFLIAAGLVVIGFSFKSALVPFHGWTPDVYQGAPTPVTAFMSSSVKFVTIIAFLRFLRNAEVMNDPSGNFIVILQWLAVLTMIVGNIAAILQNNLKRMLAYSSIAHSGYAFMGIIAASMGGESWRGDVGVLFYMVSYAMTSLGAFGVVCLFEKHEGDIVSIDDLKGLSKKYPMLALVLTLFLLSLAGIPPLIGFFGKFFIFTAALKQGLYWLAVWGAISSVIGVFYYLRPIVFMYMKEEQTDSIVPKRDFTYSVAMVLATLVVVMGLAAEPIYDHVKRAIISFQ